MMINDERCVECWRWIFVPIILWVKRVRLFFSGYAEGFFCIVDIFSFSSVVISVYSFGLCDMSVLIREGRSVIMACLSGLGICLCRSNSLFCHLAMSGCSLFALACLVT
jgi:hypothetical protein